MAEGADRVSDRSAADEVLPWRRHFPDVADWDGPLEVMTLTDLLADPPLNEWTPLLRSHGGWKVSDGDNETNVHAGV
ncbi:hypothetical protein, partial [Methylobacterium nigriterrae]|uniref:hypothetical protein n=1 Tax=Methylobacterium nigriterrae TaxID=3127512 RepID=UPI003013ACC7